MIMSLVPVHISSRLIIGILIPHHDPNITRIFNFVLDIITSIQIFFLDCSAYNNVLVIMYSTVKSNIRKVVEIFLY